MKQHFVGFALFSLIVASFVFVYAFFAAPSLLPREAVKPPVPQTEAPVEKTFSCPLKRNKLSYEVLSSQFVKADNAFETRVKIVWNGYSEAPKYVYLNSQFTAIRNNDKKVFTHLKLIEQPFGDSNEKIVTVRHDVSGSVKINEDNNLYVRLSVNDEASENEMPWSEPYQVLFVHGKNSYTPGSQNEARIFTR